MDLEYRDANLQEAWISAHGDGAVPPEVLALRSCNCAHNTRVIGHCTANVVTGEVIGLSVDHGYRRRGIARKLLSNLVGLLIAEGVRRIWLAAPCDPSVPAYHFYRALGWRLTGDRLISGDEVLVFVNPFVL